MEGSIMNVTDNFKWTLFYEAFADNLLAYQTNRQALIEKIKAAYKGLDLPLPKLEQDDTPLTDIDPFTVFALFNKGLGDDKRKTIISAFKKEFSIEADVPDDFSGIPVVFNTKAVFYGFKDYGMCLPQPLPSPHLNLPQPMMISAVLTIKL